MTDSELYAVATGNALHAVRPFSKPRWRVIARRILSAITFTLAIITVWWAAQMMLGGWH